MESEIDAQHRDNSALSGHPTGVLLYVCLDPFGSITSKAGCHNLTRSTGPSTIEHNETKGHLLPQKAKLDG